jgi:pimeloyl-ACP methyl ester carboxylesterase
VEEALKKYPKYQVTLIGHSLGGAVAAFASLEFLRRGWDPIVTTFGEPRVGNQALMDYMDARFETVAISSTTTLSPRKAGKYRRVTHVDDPVPLLPLSEWGYRMHSGEIYISKAALSPNIEDLELCEGDEDPKCIASADSKPPTEAETEDGKYKGEWWDEDGGMWTVPKRYRAWQLFFAHRDYFWRLGLCIPGGDPKDWWRSYPKPNETRMDEL